MTDKNDYCIQPILIPVDEKNEREMFVLSFHGEHVATRETRYEVETIRDTRIGGYHV